MNTYGDPGFHYHVTVAKLWALFTAKLVEMPVIPLNATDYALALDRYISNVESKVDSTITGLMSEEEAMEARTRPIPDAPKGDLHTLKLSFKDLHHKAAKLLLASQSQDTWAASLAEKAGEALPWWKWLSKLKLFYHIQIVNRRYKYMERSFLYDKGLDGRPWFKHVVFAPGLWTGYSGAVFPGLVEAIEMGDYENAQRWVEIIQGTLKKAIHGLKQLH
jgi:N-acetylated-alpha-linked acidic dipeptidase